MAKRKKRKVRKEITIGQELSAALLPGMFRSVEVLIKFNSSEWKKGNQDMYPGIMANVIVLSALCAELLLKYKIQEEGHPIRADHDLHDFYQTLKDESKAAIEKEFNELGSRTTLPNGWDNANSVFEKARKALDWRYGIQLGDKRLTYYEPLYIAALSVYKTTPLWGLRCTINEIIDPVIKEDLIHRITLG